MVGLAARITLTEQAYWGVSSHSRAGNDRMELISSKAAMKTLGSAIEPAVS
jgi:hypothetical protein